MDRRALLRGTAALATTAGCLDWRAGAPYRFAAEPVESLADFVATRPVEYTDAQRTAVAEMLDGGGHVTYGHQPFGDGSFVMADGRFYRVDTDRSGSKTVTRRVLGATLVEDATDQAVSIGGYPDADREPIVIAYRMAVTKAREDDDRPTDHGYVYVFRTTDPEESALLPTPEHPVVEVAGETVRLWIEEREIEEHAFSATMDEVAATEDAFERHVREAYVVDLDEESLTADQREIVETAVEEGAYEGDDGPTEPMTGLLETLHDDRASRRFSLFEYEGQVYRWEFQGGE